MSTPPSAADTPASRAFTGWLAAGMFFALACPGDLYAMGLPFKPLILVASAGLAALDLAQAGRLHAAGRLLVAPPLGCFALFLLLTLVASLGSPHLRLSLEYVAFYACGLMVALAVGAAPPDRLLGAYRCALGLNLLLGVLLHSLGVLPDPPTGAGSRFSGLYAHPNPVAGAAAVYLLLFFQRPGSDAGPGSRAARIREGLGWLALTAAVWTLWQARSRATLIALLTVSVLFLCAQAAARLRSRPALPLSRWPYFTAALSLVLLAETLQVRGPAQLQTLNGRLPVWDCALRAIAAHPLLGYGPGGIGDVLPRTQDEIWYLFGTHNALLDACLFAGVFGGLFYAACLAATMLGALLFFMRAPARGGVTLTLAVFWVLLAMSDPFLLRWPYSSHVVILAIGAWVSAQLEGQRDVTTACGSECPPR